MANHDQPRAGASAGGWTVGSVMPKRHRSSNNGDDAQRIHSTVAQQQQPRLATSQPSMQYVPAGAAPGVQYVQSPPGVAVSQNGLPPGAQMVQDEHGQVYLMQTTAAAPAPAPAATKVIERTVETTSAPGRPVAVTIDEAWEAHLAFANVVLAGFLSVSFQLDTYATDRKEASALSLKMVAFGSFLGAALFYSMSSRYGRRPTRRIWVYAAHLLSVLGLVLLMSSVAVVTKVQLGELYRNEWMASVTFMIVLIVLPILCDVVYCCWRAFEEVMGGGSKRTASSERSGKGRRERN